MLSVSVVIPTYKASPFIRETIASVFAQTRLPNEVIVVDDCSPDSTVAVVENIAKTAPLPVRVIRLSTNSGGPARPLNTGVEASRSDLIATLDHDDAFAPNKLADQMNLFAGHPDLGLVFGDLRYVGENDELNTKAERWFYSGIEAIPKHPLSPTEFRISSSDAITGVVRSKCFVSTCSNMVFPKSVWRACGGFDTGTTVSCDLAFLAAVAARYDLGYVATPSAIWKLHPNSFYQSASESARVRDLLRVYTSMYRSGLSAVSANELRQVIRGIAFECSFTLRNACEYRAAVCALCHAIRSTGPWWLGVKALGKLFPYWLYQRVARPATGL